MERIQLFSACLVLCAFTVTHAKEPDTYWTYYAPSDKFTDEVSVHYALGVIPKAGKDEQLYVGCDRDGWVVGMIVTSLVYSPESFVRSRPSGDEIFGWGSIILEQLKRVPVIYRIDNYPAVTDTWKISSMYVSQRLQTSGLIDSMVSGKRMILRFNDNPFLDFDFSLKGSHAPIQKVKTACKTFIRK